MMTKMAKAVSGATSDGTTDVLTGLGHTGRAFGSTASNVGGASEPNSTILETSKAGQAIADVGASGGGLAVDIAKNGRVDILIKSTKVAGVVAAPVSIWGGLNDIGSMVRSVVGSKDNPGGFGKIAVGDAVSLLGNALGVVAGVGVFMFAGASAPIWVPLAAVGSLALGASALYLGRQHSDFTFSDVKDIVVGTTQQAYENVSQFFKETVVGTANQAYQNVSESFREFMGKVGDKFLETVLENDKKFSDFVKKVGETFANTQTFVDKLSEFLEPVAEFARDIAGIKDDASDYDDTISKIKEIFEKIFENAKEGRDNLIEKILDLPDYIADQLAKWLGLNRNGKHYFYDPLVLDLDGDGIETLGHNKKQGAMFDFNCVNDGIYGLVI